MKNCSKIELYCEIFDDLGTSLKILFNPPTDGSESSVMAHSKEKSKTVLKIPKTPSRTLQKLRNSSLKLGSRPETKNEFLDKSHDGYTSLCKSSISLVSETVGHNAIDQNDGKSKLYKNIQEIPRRVTAIVFMKVVGNKQFDVFSGYRRLWERYDSLN